MNKDHLIGAGAMAAIVSLLFGAFAALAQDPVTLDPERNKLLFENDRVRVYEVTAPPGDTLKTHSHPAHIVYFLGSSKVKFTDAAGKVTESENKAGTVRWNEPVTHSVENVGTTPIRGLVVELKK